MTRIAFTEFQADPARHLDRLGADRTMLIVTRPDHEPLAQRFLQIPQGIALRQGAEGRRLRVCAVPVAAHRMAGRAIALGDLEAARRTTLGESEAGEGHGQGDCERQSQG